MRTEITVTTITRSGVAPDAGEASDLTNGMYVGNNNGRIYIEIESADASPQIVGFAIPTTVDGQSVDDREVTVPAGGVRKVGPFPTGTYNQGVDEDFPDALYINPAVNTTLTLHAYKLPNES